MSPHSKSLDGRARARVGQTIHGKYRLERLLGVGGMAAVYAGSHRNGNRVAVKLLHPEYGIDPDVRARFLREGYVANKVDHPGAVRVLDDDATDEGAVFLAMELLDGEEVDARWRRAERHMPVEEVCAIVHRLLDVLAAAHAKNVTHCDVKPENVFITVDGAVKVLDFGIARLRERGASSLTATGRTMGTPAYMPPEQARGRRSEIDGRTDLWATGAMMFTLLSGEYAHHAAATTEEMIVFSATRPVRPLAEVASDVPAPIAAVVDRALAFAKADRWPHALAMRRALEDAFAAAYGTILADVRLSATPAPRGAPEAVTADEPRRTVPNETQPASAFVATPAEAPSPAPRPLPAVRASTTAGLSRQRSGGGGRGVAATFAAWGLVTVVLGAVGLALARYSSRAPVSPARASLANAVSATLNSAPDPSDAIDPVARPVAATASGTPTPPTTGAPSAEEIPPRGPTLSSSRARAAERAGRPSPLAAPSTGQDCALESYVETVKGEPVTRFRRTCR